MQKVDLSGLQAAVRTALGREDAELTDWRLQPLGTGGINPISVGVTRVVGTAMADGATYPWSVVLKVIRVDPAYGPDDVTHPNYWRREALAYTSGELRDTPFAVPRCLGVNEPDPEHLSLWLEDVQDTTPPRWSVEHYEEAGWLLGCWNGIYLTRRSLPTQPWLTRSWLRELCEPRGTADIGAMFEQEPVRSLFADPIADRVRHLRKLAPLLFDRLESLPQTLCHLDANRGNLLKPRDGRLTLIDWSFLGIGAVGEEIGHQLAVAIKAGHVQIEEASALLDAVFARYVAGLRTAGWQGNSQLARFGCLATLVLRSIPSVIGGMRALQCGENPHLTRFMIAYTMFTLDRADEVVRLM